MSWISRREEMQSGKNSELAIFITLCRENRKWCYEILRWYINLPECPKLLIDYKRHRVKEEFRHSVTEVGFYEFGAYFKFSRTLRPEKVDLLLWEDVDEISIQTGDSHVAIHLVSLYKVEFKFIPIQNDIMGFDELVTEVSRRFFSNDLYLASEIEKRKNRDTTDVLWRNISGQQDAAPNTDPQL